MIHWPERIIIKGNDYPVVTWTFLLTAENEDMHGRPNRSPTLAHIMFFYISIDTLIVWSEEEGLDLALSFQEVEGCGEIW